MLTASLFANCGALDMDPGESWLNLVEYLYSCDAREDLWDAREFALIDEEYEMEYTFSQNKL